MTDFFISYTSADRGWAEWIAWQLEAHGYSVVIQAWDFLIGESFVYNMHKASIECEKTIIVLSPDYFKSNYTYSEWETAYVRDAKGDKRRIIPVLVRKTVVDMGLLSRLSYIDLQQLDEDKARIALLSGIKKGRAKPATKPEYPDLNKPIFPKALPAIWNVPYNRNSYFTGRQKTIEDIHDALFVGATTSQAQCVLYGLGGIGKTQIALEYIYKYHYEYDIIWWLKSENTASLLSDYINLSKQIDIEENSDQRLAVQKVRHWLNQHQNWLLIFDNVANPQDIKDLLPQSSNGHALITTRHQVWDTFRYVNQISEWNPEECSKYLQTRTNQDDNQSAITIANEMGGLPLAVAQAASYINEAHLSLSQYLTLYKSRHRELLIKEGRPTEYPETVYTTWSLALEALNKMYPEAQEILAICSFLSPEKISRELILNIMTNVPKDFGQHSNEWYLSSGIRVLCRYSLIGAHQEFISIHKLVQQVVQYKLSDIDRYVYYNICLATLYKSFPSDAINNVDVWQKCEQLYLHANALFVNISDEQEFLIEISKLMMNVARYLFGRSLYLEAEQLFSHAVKIRKDKLGKEHPNYAVSLGMLATTRVELGKYREAELLYQEDLELTKLNFGESHSHYATCLHNLASVLYYQGKYEEAEHLIVEAIAIHEKQAEMNHIEYSKSLNTLGVLLNSQGKYSQAEDLLRLSLKERRKKLLNDPIGYTAGINSLVQCLERQNKYEEAESLTREAIKIFEIQIGTNHLNYALLLTSLSSLLSNQERYDEAELLIHQSIDLMGSILGKSHPHFAGGLNNLAALKSKQGMNQEAEVLFRKALEIYKEIYDVDHPDYASILNNLASALALQGKYEEASTLLRGAIEIREKKLGKDHPRYIASIENYTSVLLDWKKDDNEDLART